MANNPFADLIPKQADNPFADLIPKQAQKPSVFSNITRPIREIGTDIGQRLGPASQEVQTGERELFGSGQSLGQRAKGVADIAGGVAGQVGAVGGGITQALFGDPVRRTGLPGSQTVADTAELAGSMVGPGAGVKGARVAAEAIPDLAKLASKFVKSPPVSSAEMREVSSALYKKAAAEGGTLTPEFTDKFIDSAAKVAPQTEGGLIVAGENAVTNLVKRIENLRGKPLSLDTVQEIDEQLGDLIDKEYTLGRLSKEGKHIADIQSAFREQIERAKAGEVEGGKNGFNALKNARSAFAQSAKMRDIERLKERAERSEQPITVWRTAVKNILTNPAKSRGYSKEELAALERSANVGPTTQLLRLFGSGWVPHMMALGGLAEGGGFTAGGALGAVAGEAIGGALRSGARSAATSLQMRKADEALRVLGKRKTDLEALSQ